MILIEIIALTILIYIIYLLSYSLIKGAPFAAIGGKRMQTMFELLDPVNGKKLADIGSGDGRIVIEAAKKKLVATGYEINPVLVLISRVKIKRLRLKNATIRFKDYWKQDFSKYDYITVWGTPHMMGPLEKKLQKELPTGTLVVSNHYMFPRWKYTEKKHDVYLYRKN